MASSSKQQKRAKRAASKARENRMVRSGQAVKSSGESSSASVEQVFNKAMESGSYTALFEKMKQAQDTGLVALISVFLVDPLLTLVLKGHKEEHATDYIVMVFSAYRKWLDGADEATSMAWLESDEFQEAYIAASEAVSKQQKKFG
ncbi:hypothetical protein ABE525_22030 [Pseudomonas wadenswilerensis]|jgi:spore maturation protein SpmA|uniref:Uncharacterized protein n=2 Tax=Pseudomonas TaxID=286 RepID=A0A5E6T7G5_PSEFL|nr:hypothetical protein [Pseudomonas]MCE5984538.1 hypothetical protein [Pseudomonas sp. LF19]UVM21622.1 hypothetical protein LOY45_24940 [Pseudomonas wadenswilerensis]SPO69233.1 conserved protein of unknown function [Pseudomonas sp. JV241A]SUQ61066.1 hypothetical protein CCOS864_00472 [Pseudomonas wadenswilerensis]VVM86733.1 hypothetical protein PS652_02572 [Pseudomonas fluorescens]